ncbi:MAG: AAA family ATPase [Bacteroidota bacterium]
MIDSLHIQNFLTFEDLNISNLSRINLIGGKNNSGKTALLEAIRILCAGGDFGVINDILKNRQSFVEGNPNSYDALFHRSRLVDSKSILRLNDFLFERNLEESDKVESYFIINKNSKSQLQASQVLTTYPRDNSIFISFEAQFNELNALWEKVVLTPKEDKVVEILQKTVTPNLQRIDVGTDKVRVRLSDVVNPIPLGTLGDGVQRILHIALGLVNAQNSMLLIDEIELGLHYSVLEKLWEMIFYYAQKWNIQVFATTHSQDAIKSFEYIAAREENLSEAQFIRLQIGRNGENEGIIYDGEALSSMLDLALEVR